MAEAKQRKPKVKSGFHITVWDVRGDQISSELQEKAVRQIEALVNRSNMPDLAIDVKTIS